jgi:riboflavin kinase/FMN adenylyltransferase
MSSFYLDTTIEKQSVGALALGSFDGVHLGHLELLHKSVQISKNLGLRAAALSFSPSPKRYFSNLKNPFLQIYCLDQNIHEIENSGIEAVFIKKFDEDCSLMSAESFLEFVFSKVHFHSLVVGFDFKFGKGRSGGHQKLQDWCDKNKIELYIVAAKRQDNEKISSTRIKNHLIKGEVEKAADLLGRGHSYIGKVRSDQGLGKKIGFPTLNIPLILDTAIAHGVYVSILKSKNKTYFGLSNIGVRPTVFQTASSLVLETHILSSENVEVASGDIVDVQLKKFLRAEQKFASIEQLKDQISKDIVAAQSLASLYK